MGTEQSLVLYKIAYLHENAKLHHTYLSLADCTRQDTVFNVPSVVSYQGEFKSYSSATIVHYFVY